MFQFQKGQDAEEMHQRKDKCKFSNVIRNLNIQIDKNRFSMAAEGDFESSVKISLSLFKPSWEHSENITLTKLSSSCSVILWIMPLPEYMTSRNYSAFKDNRLYFCTLFCILRREVKNYGQIRLENPEHHAQNCSSELSICQYENHIWLIYFYESI